MSFEENDLECIESMIFNLSSNMIVSLFIAVTYDENLMIIEDVEAVLDYNNQFIISGPYGKVNLDINKIESIQIKIEPGESFWKNI